LEKIILYLIVSATLCSCSSTSSSVAAGQLWRAGIFDASESDALAKYPSIIAQIGASSQTDPKRELVRYAVGKDEVLAVKFFSVEGGLLITAAYSAQPNLSDSANWRAIESEQETLDTRLWQGQLSVEDYLSSTRSLEHKKWEIISAHAGKNESVRVELLRSFWEQLCQKIKPSAVSRLYAQAESAFESGQQKSAYDKYFALLTDFPGSIHEKVALERCFEIAAARINSSWGIEKATEILQKYPCAPNADMLRSRVGFTYFQWGDYEEAISNFGHVVRDYPESPLAHTALFLSGKSHICQYQGSDYEAEHLVAAKEIFEEYLRRYPTEEKVQEVIASLADACEKLALRDWNVAQFYLRADKKDSCILYLKAIQTNYPQTKYAKDAVSLLASIEKEESENGQSQKR
jgi:outer membrane assembly lipoprotein YfiO